MITTEAKKKVTRMKKRAPTPRRVVQHPHATVFAEGSACFWCTDGQILASLFDLEQALAGMSVDVYRHHVSDDRNDFAVWVEYVLSDKPCADALRKAKTKKSALSALKKVHTS